MPLEIPGEEPEKNPVKQYRGYHKASYSFEQVIADLVDNSIDANATFVEIRLGEQDLDAEPKEHRYLAGPDNLYCLVVDDGKGIPEENLLAILSRGFDRDYDETELGAYGVGLKDSSLSQAYEVTLFSKTAGNGKVAVRRLSSCLVKKYEAERIYQESDLPSWMPNTDGYQAALEALGPIEHGTVILLEGMHKLELKIAEGDRDTYTNAIRERCRNYLRLVFQRYMEGVEVPRVDGTTTSKKIDIYWEGREEFNLLKPLDPFYREPEFNDGTRKGTNSICCEIETHVEGEDRAGKLAVTAWILPHRTSYPGVSSRQKELKTTKEGKWDDDGTVGGVGLIKLQGAYIYRNMRLVQFAPDRDPWLGIMTEDSHLNQMRLEVHLPPGHLVGGDASQFNLNTSKSQVEVAYSLRSQLKQWAAKPEDLFHPDDPKVVSLKQRAEIRNGDDNWPTCRICGSEEHTKSKCPDAPRCPICRSRRHTDAAACPNRPPCDICESKDHLTADHPSDGAGGDDNSGGESSGGSPGPDETGGGTEEVDGSSTGDGVVPPEASYLRVCSVGEGPVLSTSQENEELIVQVNREDPLFDALIEEFRQLMEESDE